MLAVPCPNQVTMQAGVVQEADMDEEGDADRAAHWDLDAADAAYKAQVIPGCLSSSWPCATSTCLVSRNLHHPVCAHTPAQVPKHAGLLLICK